MSVTRGRPDPDSPIQPPPMPLGRLTQPPPITLAEIAAYFEAVPRPKRYELHCHPDVAIALYAVSAPAEPEFPWSGAIGSLTGVPVIKKPDLERGRWELYEDGELIKSGMLGATSP